MASERDGPSDGWRKESEILGRLQDLIEGTPPKTMFREALKRTLSQAMRPYSTHVRETPGLDLLEDDAAVAAVIRDLGYKAEFAAETLFGAGALTIHRRDGATIAAARVGEGDDVNTMTWAAVLTDMRKRIKFRAETGEWARKLGIRAVWLHQAQPLYPIRNILRRLGLRIV